MDDGDEEGSFQPEEVKAIIEKVLNHQLGGQPFVHGKVNNWVSTIVENCLKELGTLNADTPGKAAVTTKFKYVVTCNLQQKTGAGQSSATCQYWDKASDGYVTAKFDSDQIQAICTVYGVAV